MQSSLGFGELKVLVNFVSLFGGRGWGFSLVVGWLVFFGVFFEEMFACCIKKHPLLTGCALPKPSFESTPDPSKRSPPVAGLDGNWSCEACGNVNFPFRETCNRCATPKPYVQPTGGRPMAGINGNWECLSCGNVNFAHRDACNLCAMPREQKLQKRGPPMAGLDGNWACEACGNVNFPHRDRCNRCSTPKPPDMLMATAPTMLATAPSAPQTKGPVAGVDGNWTCLACGNVNFAKREMCNRCSALKPLALDVGDGMTQPLVTSLVTHRGPPIAGVDGNWACPQCQNINFAHRSSCNRCDSLANSRFNSPRKLGEKKHINIYIYTVYI